MAQAQRHRWSCAQTIQGFHPLPQDWLWLRQEDQVPPEERLLQVCCALPGRPGDASHAQREVRRGSRPQRRCQEAQGDRGASRPAPIVRGAAQSWELDGHIRGFPKMGEPLNHPFIDGFSIKNHPAIGGTYSTPISGNLHIELPAGKLT